MFLLLFTIFLYFDTDVNFFCHIVCMFLLLFTIFCILMQIKGFCHIVIYIPTSDKDISIYCHNFDVIVLMLFICLQSVYFYNVKL